MSAGVRITQVDGLAVTVNITTPQGAALSLFTDSACTVAATMPVTITADASYYAPWQGAVLISLKVGGVELLGPRSVSLSDGTVVAVAVPSDSDNLKHIEATAAPLSAAWLPATPYKAGQLVVSSGQVWTANADHTSGGSFSGLTNWTPATRRGELASATVTATQTTSSTGFVTVPGMSVTVTPSAAPVLVVAAFAGLCTAAGGGTTAGTASFALFEGATQIDYREAVYNSGKWQSLTMQARRAPATGVPVVYSLQFARYNGTGTDLSQVVAAATGPLASLTVLEI